MENLLWACQSLQVSTKAQRGQPLRTWHWAAYFLLKQSKYVLVDVRCNYKMLSLNIKCWTRYLLARIWYCDFCLYFKRKVVFNTRFFSLSIKNVETKFILCSKTLLSFSTFLYDSHFSASQCWSLETFLPPWIFLLLMLDVMGKKIWISFFF